MKTGKYTIKVNQGDTLRIPMQWTGKSGSYDLTYCEIYLEILPSIAGATLLPFNTLNGKIILNDAPNGKFTIEIPASITDSWTWTRAKYNLRVVFPNGDTFRLVEGDVICNKKVG